MRSDRRKNETVRPANPCFFAACSGSSQQSASAIRDHVYRAETIAYSAKVFHGDAPDGVRVDTPDPSFGGCGWWQEGAPNRGMPYKWGGFDTPASFDVGLAKGKFAGDVYSAEKRRQFYDEVRAGFQSTSDEKRALVM